LTVSYPARPASRLCKVAGLAFRTSRVSNDPKNGGEVQGRERVTPLLCKFSVDHHPRKFFPPPFESGHFKGWSKNTPARPSTLKLRPPGYRWPTLHLDEMAEQITEANVPVVNNHNRSNRRRSISNAANSIVDIQSEKIFPMRIRLLAQGTVWFL
jgi:hypothetical protein